METIKFKPIIKPTLWGGEAWLISAVRGSESVAEGGEMDGMTLPQILAEHKARLLGNAPWEKFGETFPLLVKFIDARQDLSIQVHPDDEMAARVHGKLGKNEMWYVVDALKGASLIDGFAKPLAEADYAAAVADGSIEEYLNKVSVEVGDVFYIPAGRVHGIGGGTYIAEIQQSSDVTYRLYDYNRRDAQGNLRELHTELAKQAIRFGETTPDPRTHYVEQPDKPNLIVECPFFTTSVMRLRKPMKRDYSSVDSFKVIMTLDGSCSLTSPCGSTVILHPREAALVPASTEWLNITPDGKVKILESHL
ncbi:MAG: class I mannose-6-phosphate isomerase [Bacteroidales bacterium]|nr:class I mannose-6-phosphate isomerase [Bacteroidales bacterium]